MVRILGVTYESVNKSFCEIRHELWEEVKNSNVTVYTIKVGDVYITNTWEIAEWLDEKYGLNKTPFPSEGERLMQSSFELWGNKTVATEIMSFVASTACRMLDSDSAKYYVRTQSGDDESILDQMTANLQNLSFV
ncbi:hypothetical protein C366_06637 [Cryptococcus neoformans Tu401-1]|nr:hypothetical protein C366_06637 [Cryptococcus neoformans var. grubii Tu401-1]OXM75797.1 hypothetical protein C364_06623 [Cryptococcus neoformans var. grubii Bt63]